ncbi:MAG: hypothetical protein CVV23_04335 [Ignavibacteriae bacterium HGW-Ignavibacteriae-2]|jgi:FKBP-type peptidyl-prolyl cis-trans isomerase|nr:FKBP-type peptidyl-prolyl cis-trans isomerase [Bacteroidota bacterium]PKL89571.1 MAG: hypothetical protein CVV23_04335 [Ignavibacteriae bacterium HGW-Ignavibacteriae-2]
MKTYFSFIILLLFTVVACGQEKEVTKEDLSTQSQKVSYSIGNDIGKNLKMQGIDVSVKELAQGIKDALADTSLLTEQEMMSVLTTFQEEMIAKKDSENKKLGEVNLKAGTEFLEANKMKEGVITLPSGLQYKVITKGNGPKPLETDKVTVHYKGTFIDGKEFDSSYKRNQPATFPVIGVIPGWTEALKLMSVGDKWNLYIPYNLAYGENGKAPVIEPYQTLLFEVELLNIEK